MLFRSRIGHARGPGPDNPAVPPDRRPQARHRAHAGQFAQDQVRAASGVALPCGVLRDGRQGEEETSGGETGASGWLMGHVGLDITMAPLKSSKYKIEPGPFFLSSYNFCPCDCQEVDWNC